ncbi:MAG TPA: glycosyltransferase family 4 protein [Aliidongia sp.]|nr:glycosyltransferase family 4 protein [Aliidongia sp.]
MTRPITFIVPGPIEQITGGYLYDQRIIDGLRAAGRPVGLLELLGQFPDADWTAKASAASSLRALPDRAAVCIDGLALAAFEEALPAEAGRLDILVLVHHALALETGLSADEAARYADLERRLLPLCRGILCPSPRSAADVAAYGVPPERIRVVPPGTDRPSAEPTEHGGPVRLLTVATLTPRKGHRLLIEALATLGRRDWRLTAIGSLERDPATVAEVRALIADHGLDVLVDLAGEWPPEQLSKAYLAADVFVLPSYYEGYGMAFAEAMAHGLPIIGTDAGAIPETVPATAGILVPAGDRAALATALDRMIGDGALRRAYADGARAAAAGFADWARTAEDWGRAFDALAGRD